MEKIHTKSPNVFIRDTRKMMGITQKEFARLFNTNRDNIAGYESQRSNVPAELLTKILRYLTALKNQTETLLDNFLQQDLIPKSDS